MKLKDIFIMWSLKVVPYTVAEMLWCFLLFKFVGLKNNTYNILKSGEYKNFIEKNIYKNYHENY